MRVVVLFALLAAMLPVAAKAQPIFDDPAGLIAYAYAPYESGEFPEDPTALFSPTLKQLWDDMTARSEEADAPILDFDPFINGQDYEIRDLVVVDPAVDGDQALVVSQFRRAAGAALHARAAGRGVEDRRHRVAQRGLWLAAVRTAGGRSAAELGDCHISCADPTRLGPIAVPASAIS